MFTVGGLLGQPLISHPVEVEDDVPDVQVVSIFYRYDEDSLELDYGDISPYEALGFLTAAIETLKREVTETWVEYDSPNGDFGGEDEG
jgi:hypothetical protein